ncbi:c-5 sterol desaturase [Modicella reniformis]|uniref:C-5 sterol desaturase n=1 Tax=Modicella reniformis TaxID=1440133 RepID=A0A9P6SMR3_9FUNG|nr:c-5 sterol desaturase [Modicella reniformis]
MDVVLELADEYVFNYVYPSLPAIPLPDLIAGIAAIPSWSEFHTVLSSSSTAFSPLEALSSIVRNVVSASLASNITLDTLPDDNILRQILSLYVITYVGALAIYFSFATPSYFFMFDHNHKRHPKFLKNQVKLEIQMSMKALPLIAALTVPWLLGEVRGWSRLYTHIHNKDNIVPMVFSPPTTVIQETVAAAVATGSTTIMNATAAAAAETAAKFGPLAPVIEPLLDGWGYAAISVFCFMLFTDMGIYWVHRWLHHPLLYKRLHKASCSVIFGSETLSPHHKWIVPTPFSSHAFHPVDGYMQSVPYHIFVYLVPMQKYIYLVMFVLVNLWSVLIHDGEYLVESPVVNSAAHHAVHHLYFNYNYGQYSTLWDRLGGSYRSPDTAMFNPSLRMDKTVWKKQANDVDTFDENGKPTATSDSTFTTAATTQPKTAKVL